MASHYVKLTAFDESLNKILQEYGTSVDKCVGTLMRKTAARAKKELQTASPKKTGRYAKGWAVNGESEKTRLSGQARSVVVYNRTDYQLTHLLERGHALRQGGRAKAIPHIEPVARRTGERFVKAVKSEIERL